MKILYSLLCLIAFGFECRGQKEYSQNELLKIFNDHLPLFTNSVEVTTNLAFHLTSGRYGCFPAVEFNSDESISSGLIQIPISLTNTNLIIFYRIPIDETFDFHLFDESGSEVAKTEKGLALSKSINQVDYGRKVGNLVSQLIRNNDDCRPMFRPDEVFVISNKGSYNLTVSIRICVPMTNNVVDTNALTNFHRFSSAGDFGVVTSPPLHAKISKD